MKSLTFKSVGFGVLGAIVFLIIAVVSSNIPLIASLLQSGAFSLGIFFGLFESLFTNFSPLLAIVTIVNAVLVGLAVFLMVNRSSGVGKKRVTVGAVCGLMGSHCASCGVAVLGGILPLFGLGAVMGALPLKGGELSLLGTLVLVIVLVRLYKAPKEVLNATSDSS